MTTHCTHNPETLMLHYGKMSVMQVQKDKYCSLSGYLPGFFQLIVAITLLCYCQIIPSEQEIPKV